MGTLRTPEAEAYYRARIADGLLQGSCKLCPKEALKDFSHWKIVVNDFPYDRISSVHHMLVPKRHVTEAKLTDEEKAELFQIKNEYLATAYEYLVEATHKKKTIPDHFHLHALISN